MHGNGTSQSDYKQEIEEARRAQAKRQRGFRVFEERARHGQADALLGDDLAATLRALGEQTSLTNEIGALRLMLARVVEQELLRGDPDQCALTLSRLVAALLRALQMQYQLRAGASDHLSLELEQTLLDLGLGPEEGREG